MSASFTGARALESRRRALVCRCLCIRDIPLLLFFVFARARLLPPSKMVDESVALARARTQRAV